MDTVISYLTYRRFAIKYKIKLSKNNKKKTMKQLSNEIYNYEKNNNIKNGLYI